MTTRIGLTGGIACGKTEVSKRLEQRGIPVLDTDQVAHELLKPGNPVSDAVVQHFGSHILNSQGEIERAVLGKIIFGNESERLVLNRLMHPEIGKRWRQWLKDQQGPLAVVAIPLLYEAGLENEFDGVICVQAPELVMIQRLQNRNFNEQEALSRIRSQLPVGLKAEKSNWTFNNQTTLDDLHVQVDEWVNEMTP
ncbi:dephospho-CoA kinase [Kiritimatiellota bacterium B12222]|nr:dephospho-CoA kinase [Kiritimatiellota bacterium B12222]